jgi:hypothetical protein
MVNQVLRRDRGALEVGIVDIFARVTFGAAGAPTLDTTQSKGVTSITKNATGDYTVKLADGYQKLLAVKHTFDTSGAAGAAPAAPSMWVKAQTLNASGGSTVQVVLNAAGVATSPASGEAVMFHIVLKNSLV